MKVQEYNIKPQSMQLHCRTCLHLLTEKFAINELAPSLLQIFKQCTGYKRKERSLRYPESVCEQCYVKLKIIDAFQAMAKRSLQLLEELLKSYETLPKERQLSSTTAAVEELLCQPTNDNKNILPAEQQLTLNEDPLEASTTASNTEISVKQEIDETEKSTNTIEEEFINIDHMCKVCFKTYSSASSLNMHKRTHLAKRPFQCETCERGFNKRFRLNDHIKKVHNKEANQEAEFTCSYDSCDSKFSSTAVTHCLEKHSSSNKTDEDECNQTNHEINVIMKPSEAAAITELKQSILKIKKEKQQPNKLFMCTICVKTYSSSTALRIHMVTHLEKRPFQCDKCERGFNTNARLKRHIDEIHAENPIEIACKYGCGKVFHRYSTAQAHYKHKHILPAAGIPPKDYSCMCEECGKVCKNKYFLTEHSFQHVAYDDLPYICEPCNRRFRSKKHLKRHLVRHEPIKKFQCPHCTLRTATSEELRKHINRHTKEIEYPCPICNKIFTGGENMRRHKRIVHEGVKNYKCQFCDESFGKAETRKHHEMRHTGERPHKCELCDRSFIQLVALKAHLKTHNKAPKINEALKSEINSVSESNTHLDINNKLPVFAEDDIVNMNKLAVYEETRKLNVLDMPEADALLDVRKNLL